MAKRDRHPNKDIRKAIAEADDAGWTVEAGKNHTWGKVQCGHGCKVAVWTTPRNPTTIARRIREAVLKCPHSLNDSDEQP
jgi:hypothetical protein